MPVTVLLAACAASPDFPGSAHVTLESIEPASREGRVMLQLNLKNASDTILPVVRMDYRVVFNGVEFAYGVSRQAVDVPAQGDAVFEVIVPGMVPAVQPGEDGQSQLTYLLTGTIKLAGGRTGLPFAYEGALTWQGAAGP